MTHVQVGQGSTLSEIAGKLFLFGDNRKIISDLAHIPGPGTFWRALCVGIRQVT